MQRLNLVLSSLACLLVACGGQSAPPVATPESLPPAEPPADLSRAPSATAATAGKPEPAPKEKP